MRQGREARRAGVGHLRNALSEAGDTNYQERTSTMLGQLSEHTLRRWGGDLRKLRDEAERDPKSPVAATLVAQRSQGGSSPSLR
jgi:hypothetical protein